MVFRPMTRTDQTDAGFTLGSVHSQANQRASNRDRFLYLLSRAAVWTLSAALICCATPRRDAWAQSASAIQRELQSIPALLERGQLDEAGVVIQRAEQQALARRSRRAFTVARQFEGELDVRRGRYDLAEPVFQEVVEDIEKDLGRDNPALGSPLGMLAYIYLQQRRLPQAAALLQRAIQIARIAAKDRNGVGQVGELENELAQVYFSDGQYQNAEQWYSDAEQIFQRLGPSDELEAAQVLDGLATVYENEKRPADAQAAYLKALDVERRLSGPDSPTALITENNLAVSYRDNGRPDLAEPAFQHVMTDYSRIFGDSSSEASKVRNNLGWLELTLGESAKALPLFRQSWLGYSASRNVGQSLFSPTQAPAGVSEYEVGRSILGFLNALYLESQRDPTHASALMDEAFRAAQTVHKSAAANALAQTTARFSASGTQLASLVRERQDLGKAWMASNDALTGALANAARDGGAQETQVRAQLASIAAEATKLQSEIQAADPRYQMLTDPAPLSIAQTQAVLHADEILVQVALFSGANGDGVYVFFVGAGAATWRKASMSAEELGALVATMRCGLDSTPWETDQGKQFCTGLTGAKAEDALPPFSVRASEALFDALFGEDAPMIAGKSLLLVLPDPLSTIPFQTLISKAGSPSDNPKDLAWLGRTNPIALLPSVAGLAGLRAPASRPRTATLPFIGFGDPVLSGHPGCGGAPRQTSCPAADGSGVSSGARGLATFARDALTPALATVASASGVDLSALRSQCPLPETAFELRCVSESLGAPLSAIHIQGSATAPAVKSAALDQYKVIEFATHGLLATDASAVGAAAEPALLLTPPDQSSSEDDGLLGMSDISQLHLDADWVVLSACNTAAGDGGGEALSGLASAFLYAGARAVLASQWPVDSQAAVLLTSRAFAELAAHPEIGRAEALRRAMSALISRGDQLSHPALWAAFTLVGEAGPLAR